MQKRWQLWTAIGFLAALSAVGSLLVGQAFFSDLSLNNDEAVYVLQAEMFAGGDLTLSDSLHGDAFRPWMSGRVGGDRLVLVEQPTLVALLAASQIIFGTMRIALAFVAALSVVSIFVATRRLLQDNRIALFAAGCFTLSPLVIVQSALFVSYVLSITLAAFAITALTRAVDEPTPGSRKWFVLGGTFVGLVLLTRPLEGIVLSALLVPWLWIRGGDRARALRALPSVAAGAIPWLLVALLYNARTTSQPFTFALWTIGGDDSFGFGYRAIAENSTPVYVGAGEAWLALRTNLRAFPHWIFAGIVSVPLAAWGAWQLRQRAPKVLLFMLTLGVAYPLAYFFYYGNYLIIGGRNFYGPHYYLPILLPTMVMLGVALDDLVRRRLPVIAGVSVAIALGAAIEVGDKVESNKWARSTIAEEVAAVDAVVEDPAIVILPAGADGAYVLHPRGAFRNSPRLDDPVLFAADLGGRNTELFERFPGRRFYRFIGRNGIGEGPKVEPLEIVTGRQLDFRLDHSGEPRKAITRLQVHIGGRSHHCASSGPLAVEVSSRRATLAGCLSTPSSIDLGGSSTELRFTIGYKSLDSTRSEADPDEEANIIWEIALEGSHNGVAALSPSQVWYIDDRGRRATTLEALQWLTSTVVADHTN